VEEAARAHAEASSRRSCPRVPFAGGRSDPAEQLAPEGVEGSDEPGEDRRPADAPQRAKHHGKFALGSRRARRPTVQAILGHSTLKQTGEYIDVSKADMAAGLSKLDAVYSLR
jgi:hypothetical protein